ncbi:MAG: ABC transporter ATP-binding protein [Armatimonadota bacterium]|nr:ABC transporter ATP-binding protein [Armatimonadota bacterium]MDW8156004.1 ABC transporter ATP-binding protein [Armatimonadota bacterium]
MLVVEGLVAGYGSSAVLHGVDFEVREGEVVALLGRNGAGKTTTLRAVMGLVKVRGGRVRFRDTELAGRAPFEVAHLGIAYVPDDRRIFPDLTVEENLLLARYASGRHGAWDLDRVYRLFPALRELRHLRGTQLSGGQQKMLAVGRALMSNPDLLLLDEPVEGLAPLVVRQLEQTLREIRQAGVTILLADQNLRFCRRVADRGYVLDKGAVQVGGPMEAIASDERTVRQYLAV